MTSTMPWGRFNVTPPKTDEIEWRMQHFLTRLERQLERLEEIVQEKMKEQDGPGSS